MAGRVLLRVLLILVVVGIAWATPGTRSDTCGRSKYSDAGWRNAFAFIIGGHYARPNEFPWLVSLRWEGQNHIWAHTCMGALITPEWVVTAAQCIYATPLHRIVAILGQHTIYDTIESNPWRQEIEVEDWFWHEVAMDNFLESDIGVIKLKRPAQLNENVGLACYADEDYDYVGETGIVAGWGEVTMNEGDYSTELKFVRATIQNNEDCKKRDLSVTDKMVCAGELHEWTQAPCGGDNGAPMAVKRNGQFELVGVTSWGHGCAQGKPTVYTRVSKFHDWIQMIMETYPHIPNYP